MWGSKVLILLRRQGPSLSFVATLRLLLEPPHDAELLRQLDGGGHLEGDVEDQRGGYFS